MEETEIGLEYRQYIGEHYREQILVENLTEIGPLTYRQILEGFNREMGTDRGLWDYIERIRVLYAAGFLRRTRLTPETIRSFVGLSRARTFDKLFMKYMGETPAEYRKHLSDEVEGGDELPRFEEDLRILIRGKKTEPGSVEDYCRKAERYIEEHLDQNLHITAIAVYMGLSTSYMSEIFRRCRRKSLQHIIAQKRIQKACELLEHTGLDSERIGKMVGYPDRISFERFFYRQTGCFPGKWRQNNQSEKNQGG